ncbi:HetZ-related protein 2 [Phormidium sp. CCY1219]|uniref:HetZ-related protein 2 n=1 Tax=Phormidium sp. CCY1219 TaxID=2886104 RepID=UPI002D1F1270|nr:HetZ-related protein 2 [Phormidium sp. CCY1219]MEB3826439.1 HetZ-related protein 2 [Phormidium sp. CCY1219]
MRLADKLASEWRSRLLQDCPEHPSSTHESIVMWLLGENPEGFETLSAQQLKIAEQAMDYRYRILRPRYLGIPPERAYRNLIRRLSSLVLLRNKIKTWVALSRDRQRTVVDVVQEVIQELCERDRYMQQQIAWLGQCSHNRGLRNALLLASLEEYCLRPVRNQPLLAYRFFNYLRRSQRAGLTQVPEAELIRLVSDEISSDESEGTVSLLDARAIANAKDARAWEEQQLLRQAVQREFETYLEKNVDPTAAQWLRLYLQGRSQDEIAKKLNLPVKQVYRLREKVSYHAIRVFTLKIKPELVTSWLQTSLQQHGLGLTPTQWEQFCDSLTPTQRELLTQLKAGQSLAQIAEVIHLKPSQAFGEWTQLYLAAQSFRNR